MDKLSLTVRPADTGELECVVGLYNAAAHWMLQQGIEQWSYPITDSFRARLAGAISQSDVYLAWRAGETEPVGVFRLEWAPNALWEAFTGEAGYLYSLAVHPRARGQGVGAELVSWAEAHVRRRGCSYLRLDCKASSGSLRRYYSVLGFDFRGEASADGFRGARFEKEL